MIIRGLLVLLIFGISLVVGGCWQARQPRPEDVIPIPITQSETQKTVYLDVSQSMSGFAVTGSQYEKSILELRNLLKTRETQVYRVGTMVEQEPDGPALLADAGKNKDLYRADQDNLAKAFAHFNPAKHQPSEEAKPMSSPEDGKGAGTKPGVYILVTDAVQSLFSQSQTEGCGLGADWICVKQEIEALLNQGWAGCVIAVRSQFDGFVFPERDGQRRRFRYQSDMNDLKTFRPFYLFMFSPSADLLTPFSSDLREAFRQHLQARSFEVFELTSLSPVSPVNIKSDTFDVTNRLSIIKEHSKNHAQLQDFSRVIVRSSVTSPQPNKFILNLEAQTLAEADVTWKLAHVYYGGPGSERKSSERDANSRYPNLSLISDQKPVEELNCKGAGGTFAVEFQVNWPVDPGRPAWTVYRLDGFVKSADPRAWINEWSTDDDTTPEHAGKTLFLNRLLGDLSSASPSKLQRKMAELYLWVGPSEN